MLRISIIIPCYNAVKTLARALNSCLAQAQVGQIIVVDDCSGDASRDVAAYYALKDARIQLLRMPENGGPARARNFAAQHATFPLLAFLDADDEYLPNALADAAAALHARPMHPAIRLDVQYAGFPPEIYAFSEFEKYAGRMSDTVTSSLVIRRSVFLALGGFPVDQNLREFGGEDAVLFEAIVEIYGCIRMVDRKRVRLHYHPRSHVARFFYRAMRVLKTPDHENQAFRESAERYLENARKIVWQTN
ncbi:glycosyl transferase family 2 [Caballeronia temeraria]|uniref:Glycosyl transferase family 2 n=1 Tax=Caballeronia temeraria TaxID=1777137 RepID=A0A158CXR5_9BURK|nr:glycosyltransferase family 2 protein [Caballeronia temeraria]SAK86417.1 glycosyl transferase family 2 [Caballeronia temeraria]